MADLLKPSYEIVAQALAAGRSQQQALDEAGYTYSPANAHVICNRSDIKVRVAEILAERERQSGEIAAIAARKAGITKAWVLDQLVLNVRRASVAEPVRDHNGEPTGEFTYNGPVVNKALELIGRELGMFIKQVNIKQGADYDSMTDDELDRAIADAERQIGENRARETAVSGRKANGSAGTVHKPH